MDGRPSCIAIAIACALASATGLAAAQDNSTSEDEAPRVSAAPAKQGLDEVVVTGRREERLTQEPVSVSVMQGEFMRQQHITDFQDLGTYLPNVRFDIGGGGQATSAGGMRPSIRGFSTSPRIQTMESPVGLAIDGVAYTRAEYFETAFFDIDRVEVLRGPQGTLFGKNTSVGLLSVATKKPSDTFKASFDGEVGEFGRQRAEIGLGGPLVPGVMNFRIAGLTDEGDGFMKNTLALTDPTAESEPGASKNRGARFQLAFPDLGGADLLLGFEHFDIQGEGIATEIRRVGANQAILFRQFDANADFEPGNWVNSMPGQYSKRVKIDNVRANVSYALAGGWGLQGVAGWTQLDSRRGGDIVPHPQGGWNTVFTEDVSSFSLEGLVTSPRFEGLFGLANVGRSSSLSASVFYQETENDPVSSSLTFAQQQILNLLGARTAPPPPMPPGSRTPLHPVEGDPGTETINRLINESSDAIGVLTQLHWSPMDRWTLTAGVRLSWEDKDTYLLQDVSDPAPFSLQTGTADMEANFSSSEFHSTPRFAVTYDWTDLTRFYVSRTKGFRAGGISSLLSNPDAANNLRFEPESIVSWEVGMRSTMPDQKLSLNVALFHMELTNFQLSTNVRVGLFNPPAVINVGEVRAQGLEADLTWRPSSWFSLISALGFNDTELVEFPFGPCAPDRPNIDGDSDSRCDLSGQPLPQAPKWTVSMTPRATAPITENLELFGSFTAQWTGSQYLDETLDPRSRQPSFYWFDASIGIGNPAQGWTLTLAGQNLSNESVATIVEGVGLTNDTFVQSVRPPRQFFAGFRYEF